MYTYIANSLGSGTQDPVQSMPEHIRWKTVEAVRSDRTNLAVAESTSGFEETSYSRQIDDPASSQDLVLYSLWCDLRQRATQVANAESTAIWDLLEPNVPGDAVDRQQKDTAAVEPERLETRRIRIQGRSRIQPVGNNQEFPDVEDGWIDSAAVGPKRKGVRKIRITGKKSLRPSPVLGEFDDDGQV